MAAHGGDPIIPFSGAYENELFDLPEDEKARVEKEAGVPSVLPKIITTGFKVGCGGNDRDTNSAVHDPCSWVDFALPPVDRCALRSVTCVPVSCCAKSLPDHQLHSPPLRFLHRILHRKL